jgi:hypothetical protein
MLWLLLAAALVWAVASASKKEAPTQRELDAKRRADAAENDELALYHHQFDKHRSYKVHLTKMVLVDSGYTLDGVPFFDRAYNVRRVDATTWQFKRIAESATAEIAYLNCKIERDPESRSWHQIDIDELNAKPFSWGKLEDEVIGPLETQYQRFLMHYRAT